MIVMDCIARVIDRSASCIKTVIGVAGALAAIRRIFGGMYPFNRALGG